MQRKVGPYKFSQDVSMVKQQETETKTKKDEREKINELFKKIRKGEIKEVKQMLDEPSITLNSTDKDGNNPLHVAIDAKGKAWSLFKLLLGKSSETNTINMKNKEGFTPLHLAAIHNNDEIAVQLIEKQADMNKKDNDGLTPILTAASCDSSEVIEVLLQNGANLEDKDHQGNTIVHLATENGCVNVLELLLNRENMTRYKKIKKMLNADKDEEAPCQCENCKDEDCQNKDCENEDREDKECEDRQDASCEGKDCKIGESENKDCPNCSKEDSKSIDKDFARTPIGLAAYYGYLDCLKLLILHGANVHEKCKNWKTVLHLAAAQGNTGVVEQLIQDVPVLMYEEDDKQQTAIYDAIRYDQIVASLIKAGAYVNWWDYHTRTPLSYAAEKGFVGSTKILLRHDADYHWLDVNKRQPIHYAAENGHSEVFRIHASETSSEYTARDDKGENCFDLAIKNNHVETVLTMFQMESGKWEDLLRSRSSKFDTPMRRLIREMPDVARVVFDKCVRTDGNGDSFEVEFNYEFLDDTLHLRKWTISDINNEDDGDYQKDGDAKCNKDVKGDGDDIDGEEPYTDDLNLIKANHPLMIMHTLSTGMKT
ncbi:ankyrin-1-like [Mercenaria mercenaria]|uniref:ankyrin-1-like n=1 Tax=Mercenaria mercenaria TaxID=6596 RepID=UPI00234F0FDF|nr:ankyrin-1-like [Mercenaria mercenaria]